jgi:hypothetical protein
MSQRNNVFGDFVLGIVLVFFLHLLVWIGLLALAAVSNLELATTHFFYIGATQFIYLTPLIIYVIIQKQYNLMQGLIVGAILTILVNGGCWYYLPKFILGKQEYKLLGFFTSTKKIMVG